MKNLTDAQIRATLAAESDRKAALCHAKNVTEALLEHDVESALTALRSLQHKIYDYNINATHR